MPYVGNYESGDDENGDGKRFEEQDFSVSSMTGAHRAPPAAPDDSMEFETFSFTESAFLDCLKIDQVGEHRQPLPPALTPKLGLKFRTFDARLEAKYGVRNYQREIADLYDEIESGIADIVPRMVSAREPLAPAIEMVQVLGDTHVYDVQIRQTRKGGRRSIYIRTLEPRPCHTRVVQLDDEPSQLKRDYEEDLLVLVQRELFLTRNTVETMRALQPVAFTYHAMLRLWERGQGNGRTFHAVMADAFHRLRSYTALVELCHLATGSESWPSQIAVPILDGFMVASRRQVMTNSGDLRWGFRRTKRSQGFLAPKNEKHFAGETYVEVGGRSLTSRPSWFAATYMGANDLGSWERSLAARKFSELVENLDLDLVARYREWLDRTLDAEASYSHSKITLPDLSEVLRLQGDMLPRAEAPDERWHLLQL